MSKDEEPKPLVEDDGTSSSEVENDEEFPIESLVAGRSKRVTAGNRLKSLLDKEGDDELELLFAEDEEEEDVEFEGEDGEDASDVQLDSSSDDEDQGPAANGDDLQGEKELQKQDKAERKKKRKAQEIFKRPPASRKVKVDPTATPMAPTPPSARPKKKSERLTWIPEAGAVRSSSRKQTMENKEVVHQRMQESEKRRRRQIQSMEAAAKKKEASKAKVMTQADRMEEAARTEKRNAKSLNRWEQTEKTRVEEQKARLAALHNRQLQGPVISSWSGPSKWVNGRLIAVGSKKMAEIDKSTANSNEPPGSIHSNFIPVTSSSIDVGDTVMMEAPQQTRAVANSSQAIATASPAPAPGPAPIPAPTPLPASQTFSAPVLAPAPAPAPFSTTGPVRPSFLDGIHYYASQYQQRQKGVTVPAAFPPHPVHQSPYPPVPIDVTEVSARNLVILENIDGNGSRAPELQNHVLLRKRNFKLQSGPIIFILSSQFEPGWR